VNGIRRSRAMGRWSLSEGSRLKLWPDPPTTQPTNTECCRGGQPSTPLLATPDKAALAAATQVADLADPLTDEAKDLLLDTAEQVVTTVPRRRLISNLPPCVTNCLGA
jgi:hypothetical protein